ncbi:hypothetical protein [Streptomyces canus]|uniref:hypothetical protein n=1 Tax=Streptomyces canus TaxID=58343 RepID=UPI001BC8B911|nr:hypothetical protein [Streptomyces canus]
MGLNAEDTAELTRRIQNPQPAGDPLDEQLNAEYGTRDTGTGVDADPSPVPPAAASGTAVAEGAEGTERTEATDVVRLPGRFTEPKPEPASTDRPLLDLTMRPPGEHRTPARFDGDRQMPAYVDDLSSLLPSGLAAAEREQLLASPSTFGQSTVVLRGRDMVVDAIARELRSRPDARPADGAQVLAVVRQTLRDKPKTLADGDGRPFPYVNAEGRPRVLYVRARHRGDWVPYEDSRGDSSKIDSMHRAAAAFGRTKNVQSNHQFALGGPIGPASTAAFGGFGRLAFRFGFINKVGYTLTDQRMNQMETRTLDSSRSFLDSVHYEMRVTDPTGREITGTDVDREAPGRFSFGIRNGLLARLPDSVTKMSESGRIPRSLDLDRDSQYRFVRIEGFGPVAMIRDWAARTVGALPGSSAYTELDSFFSSDSFQRHGGTMARGRITTPPLFADDNRKSSLGVFVVEELIPQAAVLVGETGKVEMRDINTSTVRSERSRAHGWNLTLQGVLGPAFSLFDAGMAPLDLRLQGGATGQYSYAKNRSAGLGGAGTVKSAGQVKGSKTALYLVVKSVRVRRAGDTGPPTRFLTWSLDRMTSSEARRLAGWDDGTALALRQGGAPPFVPAYLSEDRPRTLGMHRVKEFTFADGRRTRVTQDTNDDVGRTLLDAFADDVVGALARLRPGLVVPLEQLLPPNPPKGWRARFITLLSRAPDQAFAQARRLPMPARWTSRVTYQTALQNTLQVLGVLSQQNVTANLEALITSGLSIGLTDPDRVGQTAYTIRVHATLTGRRYEGKDTSEGMRFSSQGVDRLDGQSSAKRGWDHGVEGTLSGRSEAVDEAGLRRHTLGLTAGARWGWQWETETAFGSTVTNEPMSVSNEPTHLYRYDIALTAQLSGYWRPRGTLRGLGLGLPGLVVRNRPVDVLLGLTETGDPRGGGPRTGQVLIGVPVQHTPAADPSTDSALNPYLTDALPPTSMTTERARAFAGGDLVLPAGPDGTQPAERLAGRGAPQFAQFRKHPFVIVTTPLSPTLLSAVDHVLRTASGSAWQFVREGAPTREAILRTFTPQYHAAAFDQSSGPLGLAGSGLLARGPFGELWGTFRYATTVENLRVLTPSMTMDTETTLGGGRQAGGKVGNSRSFVFGGQLVYSVAQKPGSGVMGAYGLVANPVSVSRAHSAAVVRTVVADVNRKGFTHQVLVAGDVHHWFALLTSRLGMGRIGTAAAGSSLVPRALAGTAGTELTSPGGLLGHLPEKSAHRLGLLDDGMGDVPRYTQRQWAPQPWLRHAGFGTYAVNPLDPTDVLLAFDQRIGELGLDDEGRERIRQLVTGRATRALKGEMTTTGPSVMVTAGRWGWGGVRVGTRTVRVRVELLPGTPSFGGLDHSVELEENRRAIETVQESGESVTGTDVGIITAQQVYTGASQVVASGPTYTEGGSQRKTVGSSHSSSTVTIYRAATTEPHAEIVTPYRMRITLEADGAPHTGAPVDGGPGEGRNGALDRVRGRVRIVEEGDVGELHEHVPLSLMEPVPSETPGDETEGAPPGASSAGRLLPAPDPAADPALARAPRPTSPPHTGREQLVRDGNGDLRPFHFPENGMHPRSIVGLDNIRAANEILLAKAYDNGLDTRALQAGTLSGEAVVRLLRKAATTGLTRPGTGSAQALEDGTSAMAVTAFYPHTTRPDGYQVAGLTEKSLVGTDTGQLTLRSTPDFSRALLLTVADGMKLEVLRRLGENANTTAANEHSQSVTLGGAFLYNAPDTVGYNQFGLALPGPNDLEGHGAPITDDHLTSRNLKPKTGRSFLFAVPASWVSVGGVHRGIADSKLAGALRRGIFHKARSGSLAMATEAYVITWIREDVARDLRLITDANFPARVKEAWDAVERAGKAWTDADKAYWKKRRASAHLREELRAAEAALAAVTTRARAAERPVDLARAEVAEAEAALRQAEHDARQDQAHADSIMTSAQVPADSVAGTARDTGHERPGWARLLRDLMETDTELRLVTARLRKAEADERLATAQLSTRAPRRNLDEATVRRDAVREAFDARRGELDRLRQTAEQAAVEYHRVRAGADQLTRWHRLAASEEGRERLGDLAEPPAVIYQAPPKPSKTATPAPARYTRSGTGPDTVLTSPSKETYTLHDVPRDGDAFFHALAAGLERAAPGLLTAQGIDPGGPRTASELRRRTAGLLTDHADADLLAFVSPDGDDTFTGTEIAAAGLDLGDGTAARREFDGLGGRVPHAVALPPGVRAELAVAQLLRRGDAPAQGGWNHAAADLLPLLAARAFGVHITVVGPDGSFQDFAPDTPPADGSLHGLVEPVARPGAHVVLSLADRHYRLAVPTTPSPASGGKFDTLADTGAQELPATSAVPAASSAPLASSAPAVSAEPAASSAPAVAAEPAASSAPAASDVPVVSDVPAAPAVVADVPAASSAPAVADVPAASSAPAVADVPAAPAVVVDVPAASDVPVVSDVPAAPAVVADVPAASDVPAVSAESTAPVGSAPHALPAASAVQAERGAGNGPVRPEAPSAEPVAPAENPWPSTAGDAIARGRRVPVPATGECLLYAFLAADPVHIRTHLRGLAATDPDAYDWLTHPDAVRDELRRQSALHPSTRALLPSTPDSVISAMRFFVADYVRRSGGRLHHQIVGQLRQTTMVAFGERVESMDRAAMLAHLRHHGVRHVTVPEALDPTDLLRRYVGAMAVAEPDDSDNSLEDVRAVREAEAQDLSPRQMLERLGDLGMLPVAADLDDDALRRLLPAVYAQSTAPLEDEELSALLDAVIDWQGSWATPQGEAFLPLLAHAFALRVDVVRSLASSGSARRVTEVGPDDAPRGAEVYYNGADHYDGSDSVPVDRFGPPVLPKRVKDEERDLDGDVRLNPLWTPLDEVDPSLLITGNPDTVWLYTVTDRGQVIVGAENLSGTLTEEQFDALLTGMRTTDPELTAESLRKALDGLGHTSIAADFIGAEKDDGTGRALAGASGVSGEFRWSPTRRSWVVNDKSGRYMSTSVRPGLDAAEAAGWLTRVAALFSDRLGVVVRTEQVKTAVSAPPDARPPVIPNEVPPQPVPPEAAVPAHDAPFGADGGRADAGLPPTDQTAAKPAPPSGLIPADGRGDGPAPDGTHALTKPVVPRDDARRPSDAEQVTAEDPLGDQPGLDVGPSSLGEPTPAEADLTSGQESEARPGAGLRGSARTGDHLGTDAADAASPGADEMSPPVGALEVVPAPAARSDAESAGTAAGGPSVSSVAVGGVGGVGGSSRAVVETEPLSAGGAENAERERDRGQRTGWSVERDTGEDTESGTMPQVPASVPVLPPTYLVSPVDVAGLSVAESAHVFWSLSDTPLPLAELGLSAEDTAELTRRVLVSGGALDVGEGSGQDLPLTSGSDSPSGSAGTVPADGRLTSSAPAVFE